MDKKAIIKEYVNQFDKDQTDALYLLFSFLLGNKNKEDLLKFSELYGKADASLPQGWFNKMQRDMMIDRPSWYVWDYSEDTFGQPVHLLEKTIEKLQDTFKIW